MTKKIAVHLLASLVMLLPLAASECSGNGNYDRWCYALNCDGKQKHHHK